MDFIEAKKAKDEAEKEAKRLEAEGTFAIVILIYLFLNFDFIKAQKAKEEADREAKRLEDEGNNNNTKLVVCL